MRQLKVSRGLALKTSLGTAILAGTGVVVFALADPTAAQAAGAAITSVLCSSTGACINGTNSSTGPGIYGISTKGGIGVSGFSSTGYGVQGSSNFNYGVEGLSADSYGLFGQSSSGGAGVVGTTPSRYGVYGYTSGSTGGYGVVGSSTNGYGVYGSTSSGNGIGVGGYESGSGTGSYGYSASGLAFFGSTSSGTAQYSYATGTGTGAYIYSAQGYGLEAIAASHDAIYGYNSGGNGADISGSYIGVMGRAPASSGAYPIVATDSSGNDLFWVNGVGNVYAKSYGTFTAARGGGVATTYGAQAAAPTIEDTGTGQLVAGAATVRLDPSFAATIDMSTAYRVFVTPGGDTHGLYVTLKTPNGFTVRESQAGHSSVTFDYRIVANVLGKAAQRMAVSGTAAGTGPPQSATVTPPHPQPAQIPTAAHH